MTEPITGPRYQFIATMTQASTVSLLSEIHVKNHREAAANRTPADAGPIIHGAVAGVLQFASYAGQSAEELETDLVRIVRELVPQIIMARAEKMTGGGNA